MDSWHGDIHSPANVPISVKRGGHVRGLEGEVEGQGKGKGGEGRGGDTEETDFDGNDGSFQVSVRRVVVVISYLGSSPYSPNVCLIAVVKLWENTGERRSPSVFFGGGTPFP